MSGLNDPKKAKEFFKDKMAFTTGPVELSHMLAKDNIHVGEYREEKAYLEGHVAGGVNLRADEWGHHEGLGREKMNVICCYSRGCYRSAKS